MLNFALVIYGISGGVFFHPRNKELNPFSAKPIFGRKIQKSFLGNFIATLVFMLERKILSSFFFFSQLIKLFHRTMKKIKTLNLNRVLMTFVTSCGAERVEKIKGMEDHT